MVLNIFLSESIFGIRCVVNLRGKPILNFWIELIWYSLLLIWCNNSYNIFLLPAWVSWLLLSAWIVALINKKIRSTCLIYTRATMLKVS